MGNNLRMVVDNSNTNYIFNIPNFCITDPMYEKDYTIWEKAQDEIKEKTLQVKIITLIQNR